MKEELNSPENNKAQEKLETKDPFFSHLVISLSNTKGIFSWLLHNIMNLQVQGMENIPKSGGGVYTSNHTDNIDVLLMGALCPRKVVMLSKGELFERDRVLLERFLIGHPDSKFRKSVIGSLSKPFAAFLRTQLLELGTKPIMRNYHGNSKKAAILYFKDLEDYLLDIIKGGDLIGIYPEGTRTKDGRLNTFKPMAARMAIRAQVPLIPSAVVGSLGFSRLENLLTMRSLQMPVKYKIAKAIYPPAYNEKTIKSDARDLTEQLAATIRTLIKEN